jgi:hypothetical protein
MVKIELTERAIVLRVDVSIDSVTHTSFFKFKKAVEPRETIGGAVRNKKAAQQRGLFSYFRRNFLGATEGNTLAGGAQIVGRRLARAAIGYDLVADLLAFTQRSKAGALYGADVHEHVVATVIRLNKAEALGRVKPLHGSHAHGVVPSQDRYSRSPLSMDW